MHQLLARGAGRNTVDALVLVHRPVAVFSDGARRARIVGHPGAGMGPIFPRMAVQNAREARGKTFGGFPVINLTIYTNGRRADGADSTNLVLLSQRASCRAGLTHSQTVVGLVRDARDARATRAVFK